MAWQIDSAHSSVEFSIRHMAITTVRGRFDRAQGKIEMEADSPVRISATVDVDSVNTREPKRDAHLKSADFFDVEHYPEMVFESKKIDKQDGELRTIHGDLTMRGVTKPVELEVDEFAIIPNLGGGRRFGLAARTQIRRSDFGLTWNHTLETGGLLVSDEVKIQIEVEAVEEAKVVA